MSFLCDVEIRQPLILQVAFCLHIDDDDDDDDDCDDDHDHDDDDDDDDNRCAKVLN